MGGAKRFQPGRQDILIQLILRLREDRIVEVPSELLAELMAHDFTSILILA